MQRRLVLSCNSRVLAAVTAQRLDRQPGDAFVYSDISMMAMMYIVGHLARAHVAEADLLGSCAQSARGASLDGAARDTKIIQPVDQCYYEAFVRLRVLKPLASPSRFIGFRLPQPAWADAAPTWNDTTSGFPGECVKPYRECVLQGEVSDGNAFAMGGISGHAGSSRVRSSCSSSFGNSSRHRHLPACRAPSG
jgi:serine-type D-Ala-D-Ala carboxypeptidase